MSDAPATPAGPFEEQREVFELLSQETRHLVVQYVLAHPHHLPSLDELAYLIPKNKAAIREQLQRLQEEDIIKQYEYSPNRDARDIPSQFYGFTEYSVQVLDEYNYLQGLPVVRALYDHTRLSEQARRHRDAPRPALEPAVERALRVEDEFEPVERYIREQQGHTHSVDDQVTVARALYEEGIGPEQDGIKRGDIEALDIDIEYSLRTVLAHLVDSDVLERVEPAGSGVFAISECRDEIVNGRVESEARENIEAVVQHIDDELQAVELESDAAELSGQEARGTAPPSVAVGDGAGRTIRSILARNLDLEPEQVPEYLRAGDPVERLNTAIDIIETSEEVTKSESYGRILFVSPAYRYRLGEKVTELL